MLDITDEMMEEIVVEDYSDMDDDYSVCNEELLNVEVGGKK